MRHKRHAKIHVDMTVEQWSACCRQAKREGRTLSDWARRVLKLALPKRAQRAAVVPPSGQAGGAGALGSEPGAPV